MGNTKKPVPAQKKKATPRAGPPTTVDGMHLATLEDCLQLGYTRGLLEHLQSSDLPPGIYDETGVFRFAVPALLEALKQMRIDINPIPGYGKPPA